MDTLLGTLRQTRDELAQRGAKLAGTTRDRGLEALEKVRGGALDWRRTLKARRAELGDSKHGLFAFAGLQLRLIVGVDRALASFSDRVRAEMKRLTHLELPSPVSAPAPAPAETSRNASTPKKAKAKTKTASKRKRLVLPIADYDTLTAKEILAELPRLTEAQCKAVHAIERAHKQRKTILAALEARLTA